MAGKSAIRLILNSDKAVLYGLVSDLMNVSA
jgi:hypothetical protein